MAHSIFGRPDRARPIVGSLKALLRLRSKRLQIASHVPWSRLRYQAAAVFFLFSVWGFFFDLLGNWTTPYGAVLTICLLSGLNAALWVVVLTRVPLLWAVALLLFQFKLGAVQLWAAELVTRTFSLTPVPARSGVLFSAWGTLAVVMAGCGLFVVYIRTQGKVVEKVRNELELAHGIQKTLVPPIALRAGSFEVYGLSEPSDKVGGDLVDALLLPNGDLIAYVADIAGHGLSAGILMGMLKTAARTALLDAASGEPSATLPMLLEKLNRVLPAVKEPQMYATMTAFHLNRDGTAWCAMAASPPVLHWKAQSDWCLMEVEQFPLGLLPVSGFTSEPIDLGAGDLLVIATDGVLEVCNRQEQEFGIEGLEQALAAHPREPLAQMASTILARTRAFGQQLDDQTLLLIRRIN